MYDYVDGSDWMDQEILDILENDVEYSDEDMYDDFEEDSDWDVYGEEEFA